MEKKNLFQGISIDIIAILFLIFAFLNNPFRFSNKPVLFKLTHSIASFSLLFLLIIMFVLIIYTKILTMLNLNDAVSLSIPFFIILVFSLTIIIIIYIHTDISSKGLCLKKDEMDNNYDCSIIENISECNNNYNCNWVTNFTSPPKYMLDSKYRIIFNLVPLLFTLFNLYLFVRYFNKNNDVNFSYLNKMLTNDSTQNKATPLIVSFFVINISLNLIMIFQQLLYQPCKIHLPQSWDF